MQKNVTISLPEEVANWARIRAARGNTSISRLVGRMLEAQMRQSDEYSAAYARWKELPLRNPLLSIDARNRLTRDEANGRDVGDGRGSRSDG